MTGSSTRSVALVLASLAVGPLAGCSGSTEDDGGSAGNPATGSSSGAGSSAVGGTESGGTESGGTESGGTESGGSDSGGGETGGAGGSGTSGGMPAGGSPNGGAPTGGLSTGGIPTGGVPNGGAPTGGTANGGAPTGGSPNGGATTAGSSNGGAGTGGAGGPAVECTNDADCKVVASCCSCTAHPVDEEVAICLTACDVDVCQTMESPQPACVFGRCVLDVSCDTSQVTCDSVQPNCVAGSVPSVLDSCYGPCIDATQCRDVASCDDCRGSRQSCLYENGFFGRAHCVETPSGCDSAANCACAGELCGDFSPCFDRVDGITCGAG